MDAAKLVQALSVAWGGVQLYPDPAAVPAFGQAVEIVGDFAGSSTVLTITVDGFADGSGPVAVSHNAAGRLVQALFAQRVETMAITGRPTAEDIIRFFEILEHDDTDLDLDFPTRLQLAGITAIGVRCQDLLEDRDELEEEDRDEAAAGRHPDVQALFEKDSVQRLAERIMSAASPQEGAAEFIDIYRVSYHQVAEGDPAGLERVVQTFADAFFRLEHHYRVVVFESILELRDERPFGNFLDQFSADELGELAGEVKDSALPLLVEYARVVSEMADRDPGLVERVMGDDDAGVSRGAVAGSVGIHLAAFLKEDRSGAPAMEALAAEVTGLADAHRVGWVVLADLFSIEERPERLNRLLRIWVAKIGRAIRAGDFAEAAEWLEVVGTADLDPRLRDEAFGQVATDEVLEALTHGSDEDQAAREELFQQLSRRASHRVLEQLATEEDPGRRRMLIDIVTEIARVDIRSVLPGLSDPRWYVVRNVAIALGKSGRKAAGEPLSRLVEHEDHRVRIEGLRALLPCLGDAAADHLIRALGDGHVRVRAAAADLLGALDQTVVIPALTAAVRDETSTVETRVAAVAALGRFTDETARETLTNMADSRKRFSQSARTLRNAAREALRSDRV